MEAETVAGELSEEATRVLKELRAMAAESDDFCRGESGEEEVVGDDPIEFAYERDPECWDCGEPRLRAGCWCCCCPC